MLAHRLEPRHLFRKLTKEPAFYSLPDYCISARLERQRIRIWLPELYDLRTLRFEVGWSCSPAKICLPDDQPLDLWVCQSTSESLGEVGWLRIPGNRKGPFRYAIRSCRETQTESRFSRLLIASNIAVEFKTREEIVFIRRYIAYDRLVRAPRPTRGRR